MTKSISRREFSEEERISRWIFWEREKTPAALASSKIPAKRTRSLPGGPARAAGVFRGLIIRAGLCIISSRRRAPSPGGTAAIVRTEERT